MPSESKIIYGGGGGGNPTEWVPYTGPRGGKGWQNTQTGYVVYGNRGHHNIDRSHITAVQTQLADSNWKPGQPHLEGEIREANQKKAEQSEGEHLVETEQARQWMEGYHDAADGPAKTKGVLSALTDGSILPFHLDDDDKALLTDDLAAAETKTLVKWLQESSLEDGMDEESVELVADALSAKPPPAKVPFELGKFIAISENAKSFPAVAAILKSIPHAAGYLRHGDTSIIPAKYQKQLKACGIDDEEFTTAPQLVMAAMFDDCTAPPTVAEHEVPASSKNYGRVSKGRLDTSDFDPNAVDVYRAIDKDRFLVRYSKGSEQAHNGEPYRIIPRSKAPLTVRLPGDYWLTSDGMGETNPDDIPDDYAREEREKKDKRENPESREDPRGTFKGVRQWDREVKKAHRKNGTTRKELADHHTRLQTVASKVGDIDSDFNGNPETTSDDFNDHANELDGQLTDLENHFADIPEPPELDELTHDAHSEDSDSHLTDYHAEVDDNESTVTDSAETLSDYKETLADHKFWATGMMEDAIAKAKETARFAAGHDDDDVRAAGRDAAKVAHRLQKLARRYKYQ